MTTIARGQLTWEYVQISFSAQNIQQLRETPIQVLSAPTGAGIAILPMWITVQYTPNTTAYTVSDQIYAWYGAPQPDSTTAEARSCMPMSSISTYLTTNQEGHITTSMTPVINPMMANQPVYVGLLSDASGNWLNGDGTVLLTVQSFAHPV